MATDTQKPAPTFTPSPWITVIIAVIAAIASYITTSYQNGKAQGVLESKLEKLEAYQLKDEKNKENERLAREARYQAAEAARDAEKDAQVAELQKTNQELQAALRLTLKSNAN